MSGSASNLPRRAAHLSHPLDVLGPTIAPFLHKQPNGRALKAVNPNDPFEPHRVLMGDNNFAVGNVNTYHDGWRMVTRNNITTNKALCNAIITEHKDNGGWAILDEIKPGGFLGVADGTLRINMQLITCSEQSPQGKYSAMNVGDKTTWLEHIPKPIGENKEVMWQVSPPKSREYPCLFVRDGLTFNTNAAMPGGAIRTRRRKQTKRIRKQKKQKRCTKKQ